MKTNIKLFALLLFIGLFTSCEDATDIMQPGMLDDQSTFESVSDLQKGLSGVYVSYSNFSAINFNAVFTDNVKNGASSNGQNQQRYNHTLTAANAPGIYSSRYATINFANRVIEGYEALDITDQATQDEANVILGQLYALRALAHFDLLQYYAESYTDDSALGITIMDFVPHDLNFQPSRNTVGEVYDFVNTDIDNAINLLSGTSFDPIYMSADAMKALKARVMLFHAGNTDTQTLTDLITLCDQILAAHPIANATQYPDVFKDQNTAGVIFKKKYLTGDGNIAGLFYFNNVGSAGDPYVEVSNGLYNILNNDDIRKDVLVKNPGLSEGSNYVGINSPDNLLLIYKYPGLSDRGLLVNDAKIFRSAEILLIKAEAQARLNQPSAAAATVQQLLNNRYVSNIPTVSYTNKEAALRGILKQRRIELAYEGHRYLDLKRFRNDLNIGISRNPVDCASYSADQCSLPKDDHRWILPIPQAELNANANMVQNPGY